MLFPQESYIYELLNGTNVSSPADKDGVIDCVEHFCQSDLRGIVNYKSLSAGDETLDILPSWKHTHLHTIE